MLPGRKRKQDAAAAAVAIQDKRTHLVVGEVRNHKVTMEDLLENSDVESEHEGASDSEDGAQGLNHTSFCFEEMFICELSASLKFILSISSSVVFVSVPGSDS